jgi:hypothetical protein
MDKMERVLASRSVQSALAEDFKPSTQLEQLTRSLQIAPAFQRVAEFLAEFA